jgi:hypothetical protein
LLLMETAVAPLSLPFFSMWPHLSASVFHNVGSLFLLCCVVLCYDSYVYLVVILILEGEYFDIGYVCVKRFCQYIVRLFS